MQPKVVTLLLALALSLVSVASGEGRSQYPLTVNIAQMPPSSPLMSAAGCVTNCYSGEVECKSKQAHNFQLAEVSDGNTYELQCVPAKGSAGCPVPLGTYPARRVKQSLRVLVSRDDQAAQERTFSILSVRRTEVRTKSEDDRQCGVAMTGGR